jgi:hypothetical protein
MKMSTNLLMIGFAICFQVFDIIDVVNFNNPLANLSVEDTKNLPIPNTPPTIN